MTRGRATIACDRCNRERPDGQIGQWCGAQLDATGVMGVGLRTVTCDGKLAQATLRGRIMDFGGK